MSSTPAAVVFWIVPPEASPPTDVLLPPV